jgi:hypothetical protein
MNFVDIVTGAPLWVWIVLIYLIYVGVKSMHNRFVYIPKLFLIPLFILIIKSQNILASVESFAIAVFFIVIGSIVGICFSSKIPISFKKEEFKVVIPGSYFTIVFLMSAFFFKFAIGFFKATNPEKAPSYELIDIIFSSLFSGYYLGRACCFSYKFYKQR